MKFLRVLAMVGLLGLSMNSWASSVTLGSLGHIELTPGFSENFTGNFGGESAVYFDLTSATDLGVEAGFFSFAGFPPNDLTVSIFQLAELIDPEIDVLAATDTPASLVPGATLVATGTSFVSAALTPGLLYFLQLDLIEPTDTNFSGTVSAVPVPAAGILFASALFGAGLLGRRKKKASKSDMAGAFARAA